MGKKKNKFSQLIDESGHEYIVKGRHQCLCEASKHHLINNCLNCGRIVCEQEGTGPCFTCGTYVLTEKERELLLSGSTLAQSKLDELIKDGAVLDFIDHVEFSQKNRSLKEIAASITDNQNLNKAIQHKNKLLEFDRKAVARTKVFDDQVDYFSMRSQNFISEENRKAITEKIDYLAENKFNKVDKIAIDLENMTVNDYSESVIKDINEEHRKLQELSALKSDYEIKHSSYFIDHDQKKQLPPPVYIPNNIGKRERKNKKITEEPKIKNPILKFSMKDYHLKVQDKDLDKIEDKGMCLAVQQPYASLLVSGIKKFEGRTWYNPFKGRLWIYAAQKSPNLNEIHEVENFYRRLGHTNFPREYYTGSIIGCVIIDDCLPNEVCREQYPECEIDSPYVFVCEYPIAFNKPLPVFKGGGKKIYQLEPKLHKACKNFLGF